MLRLSSLTLGSVPSGVAVPTYDRRAPATITHIGVGAFARAHLGVYADDLLEAGWPASIRGVSLRTRRVESQLAPQDGLYTVTEREPGSASTVRVRGAFTSVASGATAAVASIAEPATQVVTLTVTEKGYELDPADLEGQSSPISAPAVLARGLARRGTDFPPPVIVSLDNLVDNGEVLRRAVLQVADRIEPKFASWVDANVAFPSSVVDRLVPSTTPRDLQCAASALGLQDLGAVISEPHRSWVIAEAAGLPPLADVGAEVVTDIAAYQRRKLWLLNGPHSALAYGGLVAGLDSIADAAADRTVSLFVRSYIDDVVSVVQLPAALDARQFADDALRRFANGQLGDACLRIAADSSRKFPQRLFPVVRARRRCGLSNTRLAVVAAAWIAAAVGISVNNRVLPRIDDPAVGHLQEAMRSAGHRHLCDVAVGPETDPTFVDEVHTALNELSRDGIGALA